MTTNTTRNSELIWNIVGILSAILLLLYISTSFLGFRVERFIPVSGGLPSINQGTSAPTAYVATKESSSPAVPTTAATDTSLPASETAIVAPTNTSEPSLTPEPFPLIISGFGPEQQYTLHKLQPGESYTYLAEMYDTTIDVLDSLNFNKEGKRLWVGQYIVIMPGMQSIDSSLPQFTVLILVDKTRLQDVAVEYGISVEELRFYNELTPGVTEVLLQVLLVPIQQ